MKQVMLYIRAVLILAGLLFCHIAYTQVLPSEPTLEDVKSLSTEIAGKLNSVPTDEYPIRSELDWLRSASVSVREEINNTKRSVRPLDFDKFKKELQQSVDEISRIDCADLKVSQQVLETAANRIVIITESDIIPYNPPSELWNSIRKRISDVGNAISYYGQGTRASLTKSDCENISKQFTDGKIGAEIDAFITQRKMEVGIEEKKTAELLAALEKVKAEIAVYSEKLNEALKKATTKGFLKDNLFLMILTIGSLSIGAIALVRWFPEDVMREWVESGQVIQFVTVMIILSVIMSLGLVGLLSENTLGTLLGGIGSYVLSQGVGRMAARQALKEKSYQDQIRQNTPQPPGSGTPTKN